MMYRSPYTFAAAAVVVGFASAVSLGLSYTFDTGVDGFTAVDFPSGAHSNTPGRVAATWDSANGAPAGSLREPDIYYDTGVATPLSYLGNLNAVYGSTISYDVLIRYTDSVIYKAFAINCGTDTLTAARNSPTVGTWTTLSVSLLPSNWKLTSTSAPPTQQQFSSLLAQTKGIYFLTEWHSGPDDTNVDNVIVPRAYLSGDANRDGSVNFNDLLTLAQNYGTAPGGAPDVSWIKGDFDGTGTVEFSDLLALAQHYGQSGLIDPAIGSEAFQSDWSFAQSIVPEPAALGATIALLTTRRRRT